MPKMFFNTEGRAAPLSLAILSTFFSANFSAEHRFPVRTFIQLGYRTASPQEGGFCWAYSSTTTDSGA